jgi:chorismate lyase/3-hydroxybenzoate synthase
MQLSSTLPEGPIDASPVPPRPPGWADELCASDPSFALASVALEHPPGESAAALSGAVTALYDSLARDLSRQSLHPVRIWNFVPDIQGGIEGAGDRYMAFNVGRFAAYCRWFGDPAGFRRSVPTSSAVGVSGSTLWIHALAAPTPGRPVENPRQIPAYRYSSRFGVRPPCFARATCLGPHLFIGGTASIIGEDSRHADDIERQARETMANIAALLRAGGASADTPLDALTSLRVHVRDSAHAPAVRDIVHETAPRVSAVELVQAPLCRKELLVEIEGTAEIQN